MRRVRILTLICFLFSMAIFAAKNRSNVNDESTQALILESSWLAQNQASRTPAIDIRPADQTFLTFPEWYLVFSPAEQAIYAKSQTSTTFPLMSHVDQVWNSYAAISTQIEPYFEYNDDYHFMIQFIGVSTHVEYGLKTLYETLIGRITDTSPEEPLTAEDQFNAMYLQEYVEFLAQQPWYNFNYANQLSRLWLETDLLGSNMLRKLERRYFLTSELFVKMAYAQMVALGAGTINDAVILSTAVIVDQFPDSLAQEASITLEEVFEDGSALVRLPRYAAFNPAAVQLARAGAKFKEIAGNDSAILLTILISQDDEIATQTESTVLFEQQAQAKTQQKRVGLVTTVTRLADVLNELLDDGVVIEHIYDY